MVDRLKIFWIIVLCIFKQMLPILCICDFNACVILIYQKILYAFFFSLQWHKLNSKEYLKIDQNKKLSIQFSQAPLIFHFVCSSIFHGTGLTSNKNKLAHFEIFANKKVEMILKSFFRLKSCSCGIFDISRFIDQSSKFLCLTWNMQMFL